jgi:crotonobetainyl-CoA:carnitine CoA-transferase CaiB-like acyl-CoA transferase
VKVDNTMYTYSFADRLENHDEIDALISAWARANDPQTAMGQLQRVGVPVGRVLDTTSILEDPQLNDRGYWIEIPHPKMHPYRQQGPLWPLATARSAPRRHSPLFGEHNTEILQGELGLSDKELAELAAAFVIANAPINPSVG